MHYDDRPGTTEHFRLVAGYDAAADAVIYHEPAQAGGAYRRMSREKFEKLWPLAGGGGQSVVIRLRLSPAACCPSRPPPVVHGRRLRPAHDDAEEEDSRHRSSRW